MKSTRFPGKVLEKIAHDLTVLQLVVQRLLSSDKVDQIIIACSNNPADLKIKSHLEELPQISFRTGSEQDVLSRFCDATSELKENDIIVRITADCPFVDPELLDSMVGQFQDSGVDYLSNTLIEDFPDGFDIEVFRKKSLSITQKFAATHFDREHVTPYMKRTMRCADYPNPLGEFGHLRVTVDEKVDLLVIQTVYQNLSTKFFGYKDVIDFLVVNPEVADINQKNLRNEGSMIRKSAKMYNRAKNTILHATSLFSKSPMLHHPLEWPTYYKKASGITITDYEERQWLDISFMGIGTNVLGYGDPDVDAAVQEAVSMGNMSTLNCFEEVELAERLLDINQIDGLVKFTRSGGEANTVALRIARAATGKNGIAFCGYHGWHDWYLSANKSKENALKGHLLEGLSTVGVAEGLTDNIHPFQYNDFSSFLLAVGSGDIGAVIMEPMRNFQPQDDFLHKIKSYCEAKNIVFILDECSSGFRETFGGLGHSLNVQADIVVYGKTIANGYALNAVVGKRDIMESAGSSFISSTFWTERIGYCAGLATINKMEQTESFKDVKTKGAKIKIKWREIFDDIGISAVIQGTDGIPNFMITSTEPLLWKTLITQLMMDKGWLASTVCYVSTCHDENTLNKYFNDLHETLNWLNKQHESGNDLGQTLRGEICMDGFKRLN
jgi:glutamate-1-semialdehyde 2,1-aminomutase